MLTKTFILSHTDTSNIYNCSDLNWNIAANWPFGLTNKSNVLRAIVNSADWYTIYNKYSHGYVEPLGMSFMQYTS